MLIPKLTPSTVGACAPAQAPTRPAPAGVRTAVFGLVALLPIVFGIAAFGSQFGPDPRSQPRPVAAPSPLRLRLEAPDVIHLGQPVTLRLVLGNQGDRPVEVGLGGRPIAFDLVVTAPDGSPLWQRLDGVAVPAILQLRTLAPGEVITFVDSWDQRTNHGGRVGPGSYRVRGILPVEGAAGGWATETLQLTILP